MLRLLARFAVQAAPGLLLACAEPGADPPLGSTDAAVGQADFSCRAGETQACHCQDGTLSGTQRCSANGVLDACQCPARAPDPPPSTGQVCAQLAGLSSCRAVPYVSKQLPASLSFVVDRSRSMLCNLPPLQSSAECEQTPVAKDEGAPTKWKIVQDALSQTFESLPQGNALAALTFFSNDAACGVNSSPSVPLDLLTGVQRQSLSASLRGARPSGQTPIVGATILAYAHLHQEAKAPGNRFVVLITDGAESCAPDKIGQLLDVEVQKARDANIRTFVIGAPGSEPARAFLSELAYRGGTAQSPGCVHDLAGAPDRGDCHLDMTRSDDFAAALTAALGVVGSAAIGCDFPVPGGVATDVNVQYTPSDGQAPVCFAADESRSCDAGADGWQFARKPDGTRDSSRIVVCGSACERIKRDPGARVDILLGCAPILL